MDLRRQYNKFWRKDFSHQNQLSLSSFLIGILLGFVGMQLFRGSLLQCRNYEASITTTKVTSETKGKFHRPTTRVFFGVMTAEKYLGDRAKAIMKTWQKMLPKGTGFKFFVGENSTAVKMGLPAEKLPGVDDTYPPQRKAFSMLRYFGKLVQVEKYDWFVRVDDDSYVNADTFYPFLSSLDATRPLYLGQPGFGLPEEKEALKLSNDEIYCMGGTGMVFSRRAIELLAPHIDDCMDHLGSDHEDVEIGRCMVQKVGITCTWCYETRQFFHTSYVKPAEMAFAGNIDLSPNRIAFVSHPLKLVQYQYRLAWVTVVNKAKTIRLEISKAKTALQQFNNATRKANSVNPKISNRHMVKSWDYFWNGNLTSSTSFEDPLKSASVFLRQGVAERDMQILEIPFRNKSKPHTMNLYYQLKPLFSFIRSQAAFGQDHAVVISPQRKRSENSLKLHIFHQSFSEIEMKEVPANSMRVNFIATINGSCHNSFIQFLSIFEAEFLVEPENVSLVVVMVPSSNMSENTAVISAFEKMKFRYPRQFLALFHTSAGQHLSRAACLDHGSKQFSADELLFFVNVETSIHQPILDKVRTLVKQGQSVFMPIVFSNYDPAVTCRSKQCPSISNESGYWRTEDWSIAALYKRDYDEVGGYNTSNNVKGNEGADFVHKLIGLGIHIMRAPTPDIIRRFYPSKCTKENTGKDSSNSCQARRLMDFGDRRTLARSLLRHEIVQSGKSHHMNPKKVDND